MSATGVLILVSSQGSIEGVQGENRFSWTKVVFFSQKKIINGGARDLVDKNRRLGL